ncbi:hypothetical protein GIB67_036569 [Kingdonia uniflora]|uniref:Uncharacterized protein n=1 Tax=Kingdonia uniflora TaxID=39325 RepID=A0A7J7KXC4_9MAGN|nr:hypothetical protein GIB67_036569 [Kingdonia uniflora]
MLLRFNFYAFLLNPIVVVIVIVIWLMSLGRKKIWGDFLVRSNILNSLTRISIRYLYQITPLQLPLCRISEDIISFRPYTSCNLWFKMICC